MTERTDRPIVWVVQEGNNDYSAAEEYGDVLFVTENEITKIKNSRRTVAAIHDIKRFLSGYVAGHDFIIPSGNPMTVAQLTLSLGRGTHNFLKWDGRRSLYIPFEISTIE